MKSTARRLLETILKEEEEVAPPAAAPKGEPAAPAAAAPAPAPAAGEASPELAKVVDDMNEPDKMADVCQAMSDKCECYFNEADDTTYTVKDVQDKEDVETARGMLQEAMGRLRGKKM
jgi:hypothetical protein